MRQYLALTKKQETEKYEVELKGVEKRLAELESQFLNQLDSLLKRRVTNEQEFAKANESLRTEKAELKKRQAELTKKLKQAKASEALVERVPKAIKIFLEVFHRLVPRQQKAQLQAILKAAHIYTDGKIELEFRREIG